MRFVLEERKFWVRTRTHTLVLERDPEFARLSGEPTGDVTRIYRVWLEGVEPVLNTYVGSLRLRPDGWSKRDLTRVFRRVSQFAKDAGVPPRDLRQRLANRLRVASAASTA